jgi:hypothetical protein
MTADGRGARIAFSGSPWARQEMFRDQAATLALAERAQALRCNVSIVGATAAGPWVVRVGNSTRTLTFRGSVLADTIAFGLDRWAAGASDHGVRWTAGADRLGHAHAGRGRVVWTLCKLPAVPENSAWPEKRRCDDCWRALDRRIVAVAS